MDKSGAGHLSPETGAVRGSMRLGKTPGQLALVALIFIAFIALGLPDGLLGVGWPSIRADFGLPLDSLGLLLYASMIAYLLSSFFSGELERRLGVGKVLVLSCFVTGLGLLGYTLVPAWWMMVALGLAAGFGAGGIDTSLNAYVAARHGPGLMQWLHASYGVGVTIGPLLMTWFLSTSGLWRPGYQIVGVFQLLLALIFALSLPLWPKRSSQKTEAIRGQTPLESDKPGLTATLRSHGTLLGVLQFFLYTGLEVTLGVWAYSLLTGARGVPAETAGLVTGSFWGLFALGRVLAGLAAAKIKMQRMVMASVLLAIFGAIILVLNPSPWLSLAAVGLMGFAYAPIFPGIVSATEARMGKAHLNNAVGMQTAAASLGGTTISAGAGVLARYFGLELLPWLLLGLLLLFLLTVTLAYRIKAPRLSTEA